MLTSAIVIFATLAVLGLSIWSYKDSRDPTKHILVIFLKIIGYIIIETVMVAVLLSLVSYTTGAWLWVMAFILTLLCNAVAVGW